MPSNDRANWDVVRFFTTLNYFGEVPFLGNFRWIKQLLGHHTTRPGGKINAMTRKVAVLGGPSAFSLFEQLQQQQLSSIELSFCPLAAEASRDCRAATFTSQIHRTDTVVIEASTLLALGDLPALGQNESSSVWQHVFDFSDPTCEVAMWGALDDVVMGGVSQGSLFLHPQQIQDTNLKTVQVVTEQHAIFAGNVSTKNSGGFSSVRTQNFEPPFDFSGWDGMRLQVKGDGQRYKFIARNSSGWDSPAYMYGFDTVPNTWIDVTIPFQSMVPTFRARSVPNAPAFDSGNVHSFQLMLSKFEYDRQLNPRFNPGSFELAIRSIAVQRMRRGIPLLAVGALNEHEWGQQQAILNGAQMPYQLLEPGETNLVTALVTAMTS